MNAYLVESDSVFLSSGCEIAYKSIVLADNLKDAVMQAATKVLKKAENDESRISEPTDLRIKYIGEYVA